MHANNYNIALCCFLNYGGFGNINFNILVGIVTHKGCVEMAHHVCNAGIGSK